MPTYVKDPRPTSDRWDAPEMEHLDGVSWLDAPIPHRIHRCWAQTRGWIGFSLIERCACGGVRHHGPRRARLWLEKNSRKVSPVGE